MTTKVHAAPTPHPSPLHPLPRHIAVAPLALPLHIAAVHSLHAAASITHIIARCHSLLPIRCSLDPAASFTAALTPHPSTITVDLLAVVLGDGVRHQGAADQHQRPLRPVDHVDQLLEIGRARAGGAA